MKEASTLQPATVQDDLRLLADTEARQRALALGSFIVEAPAGAGKTELLTQRTLRLLGLVQHPEEVLALTFTNKAATEMRDRILGSLERAASGVCPSEPHKRLTFELAQGVLARDAECGWQLLAHPGRLRITTLDALCASLARQMPLLSRFGAQPAVTDEADTLYRTAARRTLEMLEQESADAQVLAAALAFMSNDAGRLENLLVAMLERRDQWLAQASRLDAGGLRAEVEAGFAALVERSLAALRDLLPGRVQQALMPLARFAAANGVSELLPLLEWTEALAADVRDLPAWQALAYLLIAPSSGCFRKTLTKNVGFPAGKPFAEQKAAMQALLDELAGSAGLEAALAALPGLPQPQLEDAEWANIENFARLLRLAAGQLWLVFQEVGAVDFIEIAARASLALGDEEAPTDLAQALDYRLQHLLVDEFQDTSPSQVRLIEKLMRGWQAGDGRTLFVVGDPMQSIYRFRKAEVGLFLEIREQGLGGIPLEHLRLYRNNRSFPAIVDWVNQAFPQVFPSVDAPATGAVRYAESAATRPVNPDSGVSLHPVLATDMAEGQLAEARQVLALIRAARAAAPQERIAVLVRARSHLVAIVAALREQAPEVRFQAVEIEALGARQAIQDLLILYRALVHRADRVHWLALLRAPWCGLRLADLHALCADAPTATLWECIQDPMRSARLSTDGQSRLAHVREVIGLAFAERDRMPPRRWLEAVWRMLGGVETLPDASALADVEAFFALMDRLTVAAQLDPDVLAESLAELYAPADPSGEAVQLMTIHKSKGLEFETVILPGLHRETGGQESQLLLWDEFVGHDGREHLLVAPMRAKGEAAVAASAYDFLRRIESERSAHESERLLYVAATRAIRHLHLLGVVLADEKKEDGLRPPPADSLLRLLWPHLAQPIFAAALQAPASEASPAAIPSVDPSSLCAPLYRLRAPVIPPVLAIPPGARRPLGNPLDPDAPLGRLNLEAAVGSLVHRCLELVARQGLVAWPLDRLAQRQPAWERWFKARGYSTAEIEVACRETLQALEATLGCEHGRWILSGHEAAGSEQAWSSCDAAGRQINHVIDRVFVDQGVRWIIDYKTVRLPEAELPAKAESFRPQLARYAGLFADQPLPLRLAVFFTLQGRLIELSN